ncbi:MAG: metal ABC transporter permease [Ignavibacteriaceae bacterium]|nr:metal ABC transporter permease [Ignavibacteriaceae bacterium]
MDFLVKIFIEPVQYEFMQRAIAASVLVGITCGLVGSFIMLRKMSLIGDALAHAVLPGVIIGFMIAGKGQTALFIGAVTAGIITSLLIGFVNRNSKIKEDTSIGVVFTGAFALGILLVSQMKNVHIDLTSYLFGDILGVSRSDLILSAIIAFVVIVSIVLFYKQLLVTSFDPTMAAVMGVSTGMVHYFLMSLLSMTIVASLQSVGVILVVAMLITPAATAYLLTDRLHKMLIYSVLIGVFTALVGLLGSYHFNFSSGAAMVVFGTMVFLFTLIFSPTQGVLIKTIRRKRISDKNISQDLIKLIYKNCIDGKSLKVIHAKIKLSELTSQLGLSKSQIDKGIKTLTDDGLIDIQDDFIHVRDKGRKEAIQLIRSHRLWESYLNHEKILSVEKLHSDAEELEHHLTEELVDEIDQKLNYPILDPDGDPIPTKDGELREATNR